MRKHYKFLLILIMFVGMSFSIIWISPYHVHAVTNGDVCPVCHVGTVSVLDVFEPASCENDGYGYGTCSECGEVWEDVVIPKLGHSFTTQGDSSAATCTEDGFDIKYCSRCRKEQRTIFPKLGHNFSILVSEVPAACTVSGKRTYSCSRCGESKEEGIPALGHNYYSTVTKEPTCTATGVRTYTCTRGDSTYTEAISALGHNYKLTDTLDATCTEDGEEKYTCSRCKNSYTKKLDALGHDWGEEEELEATCLDDGYKRKTCNRCEEIEETIYPALGHDWGSFVVIKEATCTEDGLSEAECNRCGEKDTVVLTKLGHEYPEDWTVEKEPTYFTEGLRFKLCIRCGDRIEETIPKKDIMPILVGAGGGLVVAGGLIYFLRKRFRKKVTDKVDRHWFKPSIERKTVLVISEDERLVDCLKGKKLLEVKTCEPDALIDSIAENEPDLVILDPCDEDLLKRLPEIREEAGKAAADSEEAETESAEENKVETAGQGDDGSAEEETEPAACKFGLILDEELAEAETELIRTYKMDKVITGHVKPGTNPNVVLTRLVLPAMEPKADSDDSLGNIGAVADLLGIPWISTILDTYVAGRDVKAVMQSAAENQELGLSDVSTIIADIAGVLGFGTVSGVAGLVSDVESIQAALDEEAGAYEHSEGKDAAKDIVDVVTDLMD